MIPGLRVVRGPDWKWEAQDGGEGHVGTVTEVKTEEGNRIPVWVFWDHGSKANYRAGHGNVYDLRLLDNAPAGVEHPHIICDGCLQDNVRGIRWKCAACDNYDLCTKCYMTDKHDLDHVFIRFTTSSSVGAMVPKREGSAKVESKGTFVGSTVVRGLHWQWANQDGRPGNRGKVISISNFKSESGNSFVNVKWDGRGTNGYRLGHDGKADLKCVVPASGGYYYPDHLPLVGQPEPQKKGSADIGELRVGDKVRIDLDVDLVKDFQKGHGEWNDDMADCFGKVGEVVDVTGSGDMKVKFHDAPRPWTLNEAVLVKVNKFSVGDTVKISGNLEQVKGLQEGHGGWTISMKRALGKSGKVMKVSEDGDINVEVDGNKWWWNPQCCSLVLRGSRESGNTKSESSGPSDLFGTLLMAHLLERLVEGVGSDDPNNLVAHAARGNVDKVREILKRHKEKVDEKHSGHTALQVASHQGHLLIVKVLLSAGAQLEIKDGDGDTALSCAVIGNEPEIVKLLLTKGAHINVANNKGQTPLLIAARKKLTGCVQILLEGKANCIAQDKIYGDTALHEAIEVDDESIIGLLINAPGQDFSITNKKGFNVLHHAAKEGNNYAVKKILQKASQCVDEEKEDGFTALHLAVINGNAEVATTLITLGKANLNCTNNDNFTPLHLAVIEGSLDLVSLLVSKGANVNAADKDLDNPLHMAIKVMQMSGIRGKENMIEISCYLARHGANMSGKNKDGKTALDLLDDDSATKRIREAADIGLTSAAVAAKCSDTVKQECLVCNETEADIRFEPCGHTAICNTCSEQNTRMKKCPVCKNGIERRVPIANDNNSETVEGLMRQVNEMQTSINCSICKTRPRDVAFLCGHRACKTCAEQLKECHVWQRSIERKLNLF